MSAVVRIFTHAGITAAKVDAGGGRFSTDSVYFLKQPYLGSQTITATTAAAQSSDPATAGRGTTLVHIEVQPSKMIHYEINPPNRSANATTDSPTSSGKTSFEFGPGWTVSVLEAIA